MVKLEEVLNSITYKNYTGEKNLGISNIVSIDDVNNSNNCLSWCSDKNFDKLKLISNLNSIIIVSENLDSDFKKKSNFIIVENPRRTFKEILSKFFIKAKESKISKTSVIDKLSNIGKNPFIGNNVVIENNCKIGDNVVINHNSVILEGTIIGNNVTIGANNTIGGVGFGYEKNAQGDFEIIPHIGNVIIKDNVDVGNNVCIDRAVLGSTILEDNVKVDNLVHIAHGVVVGRNSVVIANAMVAGSVKIGENSWIAPSASIINKKNVGNNALVGLGAVVTKHVEDNTIVAGNPAKFIRNI